MPDPLANPEALITLTVRRYVSLTQGEMVTSGAHPDVEADLVQNANGRARKQSNHAFEVDGSNEQGNAPIDIRFRILPDGAYDAVGLVVKNLQNVAEGGTAWERVRVNGNEVTVTDRARKKDPTPSITYAVYVLVSPRVPTEDFPVGDVGVIDPLITNR